MSLNSLASASGRLCASCGMCCNGSIFHNVRLQPGDSAKVLIALGLKLKHKRKQILLLQPCRAYKNASCSIYEKRPQRCRLFECQQLHRVEANECTEAQAAGMIRGALDQLDNIHRLFCECGERNSSGPLTVRYEKIVADLNSPAASLPALVELKLAMAAFDAFIGAHFRPANESAN